MNKSKAFFMLSIIGVSLFCLISVAVIYAGQNTYRIERLPRTIVPVKDLPMGSQFIINRRDTSKSDGRLATLDSLYPQIPVDVQQAFLDQSCLIYDLDERKSVQLDNSSIPGVYKGYFSFKYRGGTYKLKFDYNARRKPWILREGKLYYLYAPMTEKESLPLSEHGYHIVDLL